MALIDWNDTYSVDVTEIDQQHKKLVSIINELNTAMKERKAAETMGKTIDELIDYTVTHFIVEEKYFDKFNYPETVSHKKEHDDFINKIKDVKKSFDKGSLMLSIDIMNFLKDWLINHIQGTDKKYSSFFNEKGLK